MERYLVRHVKRSYGPSESSAKNHLQRTPQSIVAVWFFKSPDVGVLGGGHPLGVIIQINLRHIIPTTFKRVSYLPATCKGESAV